MSRHELLWAVVLALNTSQPSVSVVFVGIKTLHIFLAHIAQAMQVTLAAHGETAFIAREMQIEHGRFARVAHLTHSSDRSLPINFSCKTKHTKK